MARGWNEIDPDKGMPHRHVQAKIRLMLTDYSVECESCGLHRPGFSESVLKEIILKIAEKRPEDVLDAVLAVLEPGDA